MPKIYIYLRFIIRFYSNDHLPVHVHVQLQDREMKAEFMISGDEVTLVFKKVRSRQPLTESEAKEVAVFLKAYHKQIIKKWETVFIYNKKVNCDIIKQKLDRKK